MKDIIVGSSFCSVDGVMMMMMMLAMMMMTMMIMSKCLVILGHHERYISTVNCDFQSVLTDRAVDKNAVLPGTTPVCHQPHFWVDLHFGVFACQL